MRWAVSSIMGSPSQPYCWTKVYRAKWPWTEICENLGQNRFSLNYLARYFVTVLEWGLIHPLPHSSAWASKPQFAKHLYKQIFFSQLESIPAPPPGNNSLNFCYRTLLADMAIQTFILREKMICLPLLEKHMKVALSVFPGMPPL